MNFKKKIINQILSLVLAISLMVNPGLARLALAEEPTPTPQSTITTGDASASAEVDTTANTNQNTIPGEISTPPGDCTPPEGETSCPTDINIGNDNSATVSGSVTSSGTTGDNQITGSSGDATITTGDATASGTMDNQINSNSVILEPTPTPEASPEVSPANSEEKSLTVENNNQGEVINNANVSASSGENLASENLGDVQINTGDALALVNLLTLLNTNIVGSSFEVLILDLLAGENGNINLNELWKQILEANGGDSLVLADGTTLSNLQILVQNLNQANLENNVNVQAGTGENKANQNGRAAIETGDAAALANVTNIVNTNILGSQFFFGVINVLGSFEGNLILPRPENFAPEVIALPVPPPAVFSNQNQAEISGQVAASADTGTNQENNNAGDNLLTTGNATAHANTFSLVNLNIFRNNWFFLIINNLGNWSGKIFGWSAPSAVEESSQESQTYGLGFNTQTQEGTEASPENILPPLTFENQNQANIVNNIQTQASTGGNQANENQGETSIQTGNARSLANLFNLVNLNILGGRFFMGLVNILGDWSGNAIFAYPDVAVSLSEGGERVVPGQTIYYTVTYVNQGYDTAEGVNLVVELPKGLSYIGDGSGFLPSISGQTLSWNIGPLEVGQGGSFSLTTRVNADFKPGEPLSLFSKLIPQAYAAENEPTSNLVVNAQISTSDPDSNNNNNSASVTTVVYLPITDAGSSEDLDQNQPILEISAKNNVNDFIYEGDTVTFEITVKNTGSGPSYNTRLVQKLYNGAPEDFGLAEFDLGTIEPGKGGKLTFGVALADHGLVPAGAYHTIAQATGEAANGNKVSSNEARTNFNLRWKEISGLFEVQAAAKEEKVLGSSSAEEDILPYVLLFLLSGLWLVDRGKRIIKIWRPS